MTEQPTVWRATGIYWSHQVPNLGLVDPTGTERVQPIPLGTRFGYRVEGQRRCIGIWLPETRRRQPCPFDHPIPPHTTQAQCQACSAADPGQALARSTAVDDGRTYALYLAWFGPGLAKVGLTAIERGTDRLLDQAALVFTWLAHGRLRAVRAAEQAIAASGLAAERRQRSTKLAAWWQLPDQTRRWQELRTTYQQIMETVPWPAGLDRDPCMPVDLVALFGLNALPASCREVTRLDTGAELHGAVRCVAGRDLMVDTNHQNSDQTLLVDVRLLAGWPLNPTTSSASFTGLELRDRDFARSDHAADQTSLF